MDIYISIGLAQKYGLKGDELIIFSIIYTETIDNGQCLLTQLDAADKLGYSITKIRYIAGKLVKKGAIIRKQYRYYEGVYYKANV